MILAVSKACIDIIPPNPKPGLLEGPRGREGRRAAPPALGSEDG